MIHLMKKARKVCDLLDSKGLFGVHFDAVELEFEDETYKEVADEMSRKEFNSRRRDYAIFVAQPDLSPCCDCDDSEYVEVVVHDDQFRRDFRKWLHQQFGDDVMINVTPECWEWEIIRIGGAADSKKST